MSDLYQRPFPYELYQAPGRDPQDPVPVPIPIHPNHNIPYVETIPRPPTSAIDTVEGMKDRQEYARKIRPMRNISPRFKEFIQKMGKNCGSLRSAFGFRGKKSLGKREMERLEELRVDDGMLQGRWEEVHGHNGLVKVLLESIHAMMETRMSLYYGDYLAETCAQYRGSKYDGLGFAWKGHPELTVRDISNKIKKEEELRSHEAGWTSAGETLQRPNTPYLDSLGIVAREVGIDTEQVSYEFKAYADRNDLCHTGIRNLISEADFEELAARIYNDLAILDIIYRGRPAEQYQMRDVIKKIERQWFTSIWVQKGGKVRGCLTEEAQAKVRKAEARYATQARLQDQAQAQAQAQGPQQV